MSKRKPKPEISFETKQGDTKPLNLTGKFIPSGLDEVFDRILHRRAEAIVKGWIVALEPEEPAQKYVDQLRAVVPDDEPEKKDEKEEKEVKHETNNRTPHLGKLYAEDWLDGTTRYQMTGDQRAFWIDLLAMAGRGRVGGIVCAGRDGDKLIGYPIEKFQSLSPEPLDVLKTFALFERTGKVRIESEKNEYGLTLYVIHILNWTKYQSEYERVKPYRQNATKKYNQSHNRSHNEVTKKSQDRSRIRSRFRFRSRFKIF